MSKGLIFHLNIHIRVNTLTKNFFVPRVPYFMMFEKHLYIKKGGGVESRKSQIFYTLAPGVKHCKINRI